MDAKLRRLWMEFAGWDDLDAWVRKLPGQLPWKAWRILEKEKCNDSKITF